MAEETKAETAKRKKVGFTTRTITPAVFLTGEYTTAPVLKAAELTKLMQGLLVWGIWKDVKDAALSGVPAGTFIIVDDPNTPDQDFTVQIVPRVVRKRIDPKDPIVKA